MLYYKLYFHNKQNLSFSPVTKYNDTTHKTQTYIHISYAHMLQFSLNANSSCSLFFQVQQFVNGCCYMNVKCAFHLHIFFYILFGFLSLLKDINFMGNEFTKIYEWYIFALLLFSFLHSCFVWFCFDFVEVQQDSTSK